MISITSLTEQPQYFQVLLGPVHKMCRITEWHEWEGGREIGEREGDKTTPELSSSFTISYYHLLGILLFS